MKKIIIILLAFGLFSCNKEKPFSTSLNQALKNYQKEYPIPQQTSKKRIYIYSIHFFKLNNDTIVEFQRFGGGINIDEKSHGIYQDENIKPTIVYDELGLGKKFVLLKGNTELNSKYIWRGGNQAETFPPIHSYYVKNEKLIFKTKDTIWKKWD
ncbi:hypothetical protein ACHRVW_23660 [Flavobacterium collinsii]|uniref:hypothetical protein n=1 Tax=Flavobacterium collinsii TaxID=1114861 RepID=UPI003756CC15